MMDCSVVIACINVPADAVQNALEGHAVSQIEMEKLKAMIKNEKKAVLAVFSEDAQWDSWQAWEQEPGTLSVGVVYTPDQEVFRKCIAKAMEEIQMRYELSFYRIALQTMADTMPDLVWFKRLDGIHTLVNKAFSEASGKTREQAVGADHFYIWDVPRPAESEGFACEQSEEIAISTGKTYIGDEPVKTKSGLKQFTTYKSPLYDLFGNVYGTVGVGKDVTNLNNLGIELSILVENIPFPMVIFTTEWEVVRMNKDFSKLANIQDEEEKREFDYLFWKERRMEMVGEPYWNAEKHLSTSECNILVNDEKRHFKVQELAILDFFGNVAGYFVILNDITYQRIYEQSILKAANTDKLTGMKNRRFFYKFLGQNLKRMLHILYMDLDHFKEVNDTLGHAVGDEVLVTTARLIHQVFPEAVSARLGGDEFVVVDMEHSRSDIEEHCRKLEGLVAEAFRDICGVTVSIGIAESDGKAKTAEEVIQKGDALMYEIKKAHHAEQESQKEQGDGQYRDEEGYFTLRVFLQTAKRLIDAHTIGNYVAAMFNIKHLYLINQQLGREAGSRVLRRYVEGLEKIVRMDGALCRIGLDTFAVIAEKADLCELLDYFSGMDVVYEQGSREVVHISATAGIYELDRDLNDLQTAQDIMDCLVTAQTAAKNGTEDIVYYNEEMQQDKKKTADVQRSFSHAILCEDFLVYYQPMVSLENGQIWGAEALCRWKRHGKIVPPLEFIPILEQSTNIQRLDLYMLDHVCRDISHWVRQGREVPSVSVNITVTDFLQEDFLHKVIGTVERYHIPHELIELELTGGEGGKHFSEIRSSIETLLEHGIRAITGRYGMGFAELESGGHLPWNALKIDRDYIPKSRRFLGSQKGAIFKAMISLAHMLGMECIAEGVETREQLEVLQDGGCDVVQGYYFDRPLPVEEFEKKLEGYVYDVFA